MTAGWYGRHLNDDDWLNCLSHRLDHVVAKNGFHAYR
jgi:hypothetical protein